MATTLTNLGVLYGKTGDYSRAELRLKRALDINEQFLGPSHPQTELALNNLASVYAERNEYAKAQPAYLY
jgi:Tfp pilus assembly protein PilF